MKGRKTQIALIKNTLSRFETYGNMAKKREINGNFQTPQTAGEHLGLVHTRDITP